MVGSWRRWSTSYGIWMTSCLTRWMSTWEVEEEADDNMEVEEEVDDNMENELDGIILEVVDGIKEG